MREEISPNQCPCGGKTIEGEGLSKEKMLCEDCGAAWETNPCYNCGKVIDSRESARCSECQWTLCPQCKAHDPDCMATMEYYFSFSRRHPKF